MGGTDVNASASSSSSATSGVKSDQRLSFGDVIIGGSGSKPIPAWVWVAVAGLGLVGLVVFLVRR
jgi:hypothetical protein